MTIITLIDGSEFNGAILEEDDEKIKFRTQAGVEIEILRDQLEKVGEFPFFLALKSKSYI